MAGPVRLAVVGDRFTDGCRILLVLWEGSTTAGDRAIVQDPVTGNVLFPGRTPDTHTFLGANFGPSGIPAPNGFQLTRLDSGTVYVYLRED